MQFLSNRIIFLPNENAWIIDLLRKFLEIWIIRNLSINSRSEISPEERKFSKTGNSYNKNKDISVTDGSFDISFIK